MSVAGGGMATEGDEAPKTTRPGEEKIEVRTSYDANVEFYGIVRIYNPVDEEKLTGKKPAVQDPAKPSP